ncbi:M15 family metallopeptidase [Fluoribacter dumoffii]|uniref:D-alanyl-D-alanine dipeptidase n=1 Tax=Fluoribacter dumoffii TaxID=463 RepID=A0A377G6E5_9GAMM|nr:M15 family metallopeptidase [Fluoribacter dumoffii]KTC92549.1 D-alanyl-D-alanine dipeptidase [Fluoribacter dumoffii NY 23]MCW8387125.1 M15 family metallopeptidase [Fluoribacter dumoffii]MCW8497328.1 M15 family metallopeptidase [Fluoribacter dumoffii]STO20219.1 D-alanyl-D-alanine dipeptidase [Fluoribacter dumoffii]
MSDHPELEPVLLIADPRIIAISVVDNHEPMIDLIEHPELSYGPSPEIPNNTDYTKMRKTVFEKLKQAQSLLPQGLRFCLYESYRSLALQKSLFDIRYAKVEKQHPEWSSEQIFIETTRMVSPVTNLDGSPNIPPHSTGAAIDIYLINEQGEAIEMGIHPKDWMEDLEGTLSVTASTIISEQAKQNRRIMSHALEAVGFVNYRHEYWHWSYGDRYWAYYKQKPCAIYDSCK